MTETSETRAEDGREELAAIIYAATPWQTGPDHDRRDLTWAEMVEEDEAERFLVLADHIEAAGWRPPAVVAGLVAEVESLKNGSRCPECSATEWNGASIARADLDEANRRLGAVAALAEGWRDRFGFMAASRELNAVLGPASGPPSGPGLGPASGPASGAVEGADCASCGEIAGPDCAKSQRSCGHHCNHSWDQDECHWCGVTFGEDGVETPSGAVEGAGGAAAGDVPTAELSAEALRYLASEVAVHAGITGDPVTRENAELMLALANARDALSAQAGMHEREVPRQPVIRLPRLAGGRELARKLIDEAGDIRGWDVVIDTRELRSAAPSFVRELLTGLDAAGARTVVITYLHPDFAVLTKSANPKPMTATTEGRNS